jgi:hypothetical protein
MSGIVIGSVTGGVLNPGARLDYNSDGSITGTAHYTYAKTDSVSVIENTHPNDSRALAVSFTTEMTETMQEVNITYRGVWSSGVARVDIQAALQASPIETHPNFVSTLGGTPGSPLNDAIFDSSGVFQGWPAGAPDNLGGVRFFLQASNTYRFTYTTSVASDVVTALGNTGNIASSLSGGGLSVSQTDGFMLQNVTAQWEYPGFIPLMQYTVVWVSTQPPGWNTAIYPP